jgi:hypothetical protein
MLKLPEGWFSPTPKEESEFLDELSKELVAGHPLFQLPVRLIAHRNGATDDILVQPLNEAKRFVVVHLTWKSAPELYPPCPAIDYDGDFAGFEDYEREFGKA